MRYTPPEIKGRTMDISKIKIGDSVYVKSKGWTSKLIAFVSSGGKQGVKAEFIPSHEARVYSIDNKGVKLIEVIFGGKRFYYLKNYLKKKSIVCVKRDKGINEYQARELVGYLVRLDVGGYDWKLFFGLGVRGVLRKVFRGKFKFNWVSNTLDDKMCFICSEFCNNGRRFVGLKVNENETPYDDYRKIPAELIANNA